MNGQVEVTWKTLRTILHYLMVHARVLETYMHFALVYMTDHIFPVIPIKDLINEDGDMTTPFKLETGTNPSVSHLIKEKPVLKCVIVLDKDNQNGRGC